MCVKSFDMMVGPVGMVEHPNATTSQPFAWEGKSAMPLHPTDGTLPNQRLFNPKRFANCKWCGKEFKVPGNNPGIYCSRACKSEWQRTQKPVDYDWLYEKYAIEKLSAPKIARIVGRDPKRIWQWLYDYGIPIRPRGSDSKETQYPLGHKLGVGRVVSEETCKKHSEIAKASGRVPYDPAVGSYMKGKKGSDVPSWKGGVTPIHERIRNSAE